ncbi:MAG: class II aldolase/adducin family protein [Victivallales bacterium]|nr:class II aldolase/adducin family protein [Victivallales bacterium]
MELSGGKDRFKGCAWRCKKELASFMRRLYRLKLTTTLGGNISMRLPDGRIIITPSATDKGRMAAEDIGVVDIDGNVVGKAFIPTIETGMHIGIYKAREDVNAVVHAHPVHVCAFASTSAGIDYKATVETYVVLGRIAYARYYPMGSPGLAEEVAGNAISANCVVMRNHGAITLGDSLLQAFDRMEVLENAARMTIITGPDMRKFYRPLNKSQLKPIDCMLAEKQ